MSTAVGILVIVGLFAVVLGGLAWAARRLRTRDAGAVMNPFDELWHPVALQARRDTEVQQEQPAPAPHPGDRLV
ncbi:hypothetical protein GCM10009836_21500 [Pseudonocardia ailaonensis]|uniref:Secreted protein n=1 Tax=Pseudonocardia ailaonensis TaxID=367279 RepID=A0ABN2MYA0_9PSEU